MSQRTNGKVFGSEKRRQVLDGEFEGSDDALRMQKRRLKNRAQQAVQDLIAVAESEEIDNKDVFHPDDTGKLVMEILGELHDNKASKYQMQVVDRVETAIERHYTTTVPDNMKREGGGAVTHEQLREELEPLREEMKKRPERSGLLDRLFP